ncbi:hypothetical protein CPJCM30710_13190 [Clostridium polyendosporum]|uniref:ABC transporter domain-containing protein n=1 Tax=Clostridium polyendosporum TaxID=69208 RepID=A0A919VLJ2_9CLOT|nr:ABC transporter ATP-binding protein [Clostridium polyendosporum]GIM28653.1 hypothetical protein CPJCM30710_13190 [Clostridium polyendosporum]
MIEFKDISLLFDDKIIFKDFNLKIKRGEKVLLNAPSGSGKSTLFKLLLGFERPQEGQIELDGKNISSKTIKELRNKIAYVSQDVDIPNQKVDLVIEEIFDFHYNKNKELDRKKLSELLKFMNLSDEILSKQVNELSGGERARIGFIIAILLDRPILLLDEVTSALDSELKEKVVELTSKLDKTVLVISHDILWSEQKQFRIVRW